MYSHRPAILRVKRVLESDKLEADSLYGFDADEMVGCLSYLFNANCRGYSVPNHPKALKYRTVLSKFVEGLTSMVLMSKVIFDTDLTEQVIKWLLEGNPRTDDPSMMEMALMIRQGVHTKPLKDRIAGIHSRRVRLADMGFGTISDADEAFRLRLRFVLHQTYGFTVEVLNLIEEAVDKLSLPHDVFTFLSKTEFSAQLFLLQLVRDCMVTDRLLTHLRVIRGCIASYAFLKQKTPTPERLGKVTVEVIANLCEDIVKLENEKQREAFKNSTGKDIIDFNELKYAMQKQKS